MTFGKALHTIRKSKGMTLKEAAGNAVSISHLSRVEREENKLSADEFFEILENLNSSVEEFQFIKEDKREKKLADYLERISEAVNQKNLSKVKKIQEEIQAQSITFYSWEQFFLHLIENIYLGLENEPFNPNPVLRYLMQVENWGEMELKLYVVFSFTFESETVYQFMRMALRKSKAHQTLPKNKHIIYDLLRNNFSIFLFKRHSHYAEEVINIYEKEFAEKNPYIDVHIDFLFNKGVLALKRNDEINGKKYCHEAIHLSYLFKQFEQERNLKERYDFWLSESDRPTSNELNLKLDIFG